MHTPLPRWVKTRSYRTATWPSASPRLTDIIDRVLPVLPVTEALGRCATATLACSKARGVASISWLGLSCVMAQLRSADRVCDAWLQHRAAARRSLTSQSLRKKKRHSDNAGAIAEG